MFLASLLYRLRGWLACGHQCADWPSVWQLGGKNLSPSYSHMVAGYRQTSKIVVTSISNSGDNVSARILAYETTGAVQTYALSYLVSGGVIVAGQSTLLGTR